MDEDSNLATAVLDRRQRTPRIGRRQLDRPARLVHVAVLFAKPVADDERRITERPRQPVAQRAGRFGFSEVDHQPLSPPPGPTVQSRSANRPIATRQTTAS